MKPEKTSLARVVAIAYACVWIGLGTAGAQTVEKISPRQPVKPLPAGDAKTASDKTEATGLTDQFLYQYLISEIAGQRGREGLAMRGLLDLAKKTGDPRLARRAVEVAFQARDMTQALDATILWLELEPNSPVARQALNALAGSQGTLEAARASIETLLSQPDKTAGVLMQLSTLFARFPEKTAVLTMVRELVAPHLALPEAHFALAAVSLAAKELPAALIAINQAEKNRAGWIQAAILKSQILRETSDKEAEAYLATFVEKYPEASEVRLTYARMLVARKNYVLAREQFRIASRLLPADIEIPYAMGLLSQKIEDLADAEVQFKRVLELMPRDPNPVLFNLGSVAEGRKQPAKAIEWYSQISGGEYFVSSRLKIAGIRATSESIAAGRKYLQEAQIAERESPETYVQLILAEAQLLRDLKNHAEAFKLLSEAIQKNPDTADLLYDRAMVAEKIGKLDVMEADLRRVIELKPDNAHAYNALGYTFAERNQRLAEAYELVQQALKLAPDDAFIQDSLGWVQFRLGRIDEAYKTLRAAYELRRDPEIAAHLGEILWKKGERDEALNLWRSAILENPDNELLAAVMRKYQP